MCFNICTTYRTGIKRLSKSLGWKAEMIMTGMTIKLNNNLLNYTRIENAQQLDNELLTRAMLKLALWQSNKVAKLLSTFSRL